MSKTNNRPFISGTLLFIVIILFSNAIFTSSCTKMDINTESRMDVQQRFFNVPATAPKAVHQVAAALKRQHAIGDFIPELVEKEGYAKWENAHINEVVSSGGPLARNSEGAADTVEVFIPIVQEGANLVTGFFYSRILGDSVALHLYRANDYDKYPNGKTDSAVVTAELLTITLLQLNDEMFGHRKFKLLDSNLFKNEVYHATYRTIELDTVVVNGGRPRIGGKKAPDVFLCYYTPSSVCTCGGDGCSTCLAFTCHNTNPNGGGTIGGTTGSGYNWPPDAPIPSGGGGGGGNNNPPPGDGNCSGTSDCGELRSLIEAGKVPCGGCGSGPIAIPPDEPEIPYIPVDSCAIANAIALKMDTLYMKGKVDSMLNTIPGWQSLTFEKGFPVYKTYTQNMTTGAVSITGYNPGAIQGSSYGSQVNISFTFPPGSSNIRAAGQAHIHPAAVFAAPSPGDLFTLIDNHNIFNNAYLKLQYEGTIVAAADDSKYALSISAPAYAQAFALTKAANFDPLTANWKDSSDIRKSYEAAFTEFFIKYSGITDTIIRENRAFEMAQAAVLRQFNTGITLCKRDSTGHFKPIIINAVKNPSDSTKKTYIQVCL